MGLLSTQEARDALGCASVTLLSCLATSCASITPWLHAARLPLLQDRRLRSFLSDQRDVRIRLKLDNYKTVAYLMIWEVQNFYP